MKTIKPLASSFRDPSGFVFIYSGKIYRAVADGYSYTYDYLMDSGLYKELVHRNLLIPHSEVTLPVQTEPGIYKILLPEQIDFISYPYEWCFAQWKEVLMVFLEINRTALRYGMILRDATPFNITFYKGRPVFFDTLSFVFYKEGESWTAYRQFCESILGPLALIKYNGSNWIRQFSTFINGVQLSYISNELPWYTYCNPTILLHIHWQAKYEGKKGKKSQYTTGLNAAKLTALFNMISHSIAHWNSTGNKKTKWLDYYSEQIISSQYLSEKEAIIETWLARLQPAKLTDLGANNGKFTMIGGKYSAQVVAVESDAGCVSNLYEQIVQTGKTNINIILADLMQPSPGIGWNNTEREKLLSRLQANTVMALALIHHLCIANNLPLDLFASFISAITVQYAIVEFIPKSDPMVTKMLVAREDIFTSYTETEFVRCFEKYFVMQQIQEMASVNRSVYLWKKK